MDLDKLPRLEFDEETLSIKKILPEDIQEKNKNNPDELTEEEYYTEGLLGQKKPRTVSSAPIRDAVYDAYNDQGKVMIDLTLRAASDNTNLHGKYINEDGELADIDLSGYRTADSKMFGGNGLVYLRQTTRPGTNTEIRDAVSDIPVLESIGKWAQQLRNKYDNNTVYSMLVPGVDPRNGQPILKEVIGTFKDFQEKDIAITSKYGFAEKEDGFFASYAKGVLNIQQSTDEVLFGAMAMAGGMSHGNSLGSMAMILHQQAMDANDKRAYFASESSMDSWKSLDWFASGFGQAVGSLGQFGQFGRATKLATSTALAVSGKIAGKEFSKDLAKRKVAENIASWGASGIIGTGHAIGEARRAGLSDDEAFAFALVVGGINTVIEKFVNVEFDDMMMGASAKYLSRQILREMGGEVSEQAMRQAGNGIMKSLVAGGKQTIKSTLGETVEEISQTVNEQAMRTFHDFFLGKGREYGEGRFEESGFHIDEILQAGFFGAMGSAYMSLGSLAINRGQSDSFSNKLITEGKGKLILDGLEELKAAGKISQEQFEKESKNVRVKMDLFHNEKQLFAAIEGHSHTDEMRNHLMNLVSVRASYQGMIDGHTSELAQNTNMTPDEAKAFAETKRKAIDRIQDSIAKVNEVLDEYRSEEGIRKRNEKIEKTIKDGQEARESVFSNLVQGEVALSSAREILERYNRQNVDQQERTFLARTASEMELLIRSINSGELQKLVGDERFEEFKTRISEDLRGSNFYLHPSINTDSNRSLLTGELGLDENLLPLTASELEQAQKDPSQFKNRYKTVDEIYALMESQEFQTELDEYLQGQKKSLVAMSEGQKLASALTFLYSNKNKFGLTDGMLHSVNQYSETMALLDNDDQLQALQQMMDSSDKPLTLLTGQKGAGERTTGFHQAVAGNVALIFDRKRIQELRGKRDTEGLTDKEQKELKALQDDLFHKLTHETVHNLFDYAIGNMHKAYLKYLQTGQKTQDALLFERIYNLANLAYQGLAGHKDADSFYFFNTVMSGHSEKQGFDAAVDAGSVVKEFFAEALSNRSFQEALDSFNLNGKKNRKIVASMYNYSRPDKFTFKSLLSEVLDVFSSVFAKLKDVLSPKARTILSEAMALANPISFNMYYQYAGESVPGIESMDISDYNPALLIDNEAVFVDWTLVPTSILHRLSSRNYNLKPQDAQIFEDRIADFLIQEVLKDGETGLPIETLKVIYFGATDSFLITWKEMNEEGQEVTRRQFFNRYGQMESLNTNVFNTTDANSLKKPYSITDFAPENDNSMESMDKRDIANNFMRALSEGMTGEASLNLNRSKVFGYADQAFRGEVEIVYTFQDGTKAVIGYAPDLAKMRLSRLLGSGAHIPVNVNTVGAGSAVFIRYNTDGDPNSGIKRVINARDYNYVLPQDLADQGYVFMSARTDGHGFMPRTEFTFSDDVKVDNIARVKADDADSFTNKDENIEVDISHIPSGEESAESRRKRIEQNFRAVVDPGFSFYNELDRRNPFDERAWHVRDVITRTMKYKIMTGLYTHAQIKDAIQVLVEMANEKVLANELTEGIEPARAENLGYLTKVELDAFIESIVSKEAIDKMLKESEEGVRQDWDGHGLNPNDTVFAMVKAQLEQITYNNPETGRSQVMNFADVKDVLFDASRKSSTFAQMVDNLKKIASDDKYTAKEKSIAKSLNNYYSQNLVYPKSLGLIDENGDPLDHVLSNQIANQAATNTVGTSDFKTRLLDIAESGEVFDASGKKIDVDVAKVQATARSLYAYYASPEANYLGLVTRYGANSLYTSFASLRRVDSVTMMPNEWDGGFVSYNGSKKMKDRFMESMLKGIEDVVSDIRNEKTLTVEQKHEKLWQKIIDKHTEMFGGSELTVQDVQKFIFKIQNNLDAGANGLAGYHKGEGITDGFMQKATPEVFKQTVQFVQAFYATIGMDIPLAMLQRYEDESEVMKQGLRAKEALFMEEMDAKGFEEGMPEYEKALSEFKADAAKFMNLFKDHKYAYSTSYFAKSAKRNEKSLAGNYPTLALLSQGMFFMHSKAFNELKFDKKQDYESAETRKVSDEVLFYNTSSQSDEFYFDPKGEKRFSVKVKSGSDKLIEDLTDNKDGLRSRMMATRAWKRNKVLQVIERNHGKPIDMIISGIRNGAEGNSYTGSSDLDFAFTNLAGFIAFYDHDDSYIHIDDIPSDKPTIYGYKLDRIDKGELQTAINDIVAYEKEKMALEKNKVSQVFGTAIFRPDGKPVQIKEGKTPEQQRKINEKFSQLVEGVHYKKSGDGYLLGRFFDESKAFYGLPDDTSKIAAEIIAEGKALYEKLKAMGLKVPVNRKFMEANNPKYRISQLEKELNFEVQRRKFMEANNPKYRISQLEKELNFEVQRFEASENPTFEMEQNIEQLENALQTAREKFPQDIKDYNRKLEERREQIFVNEFYPTHTVNRFHLSQLKMGDYAYYKDDFFSDLNKRMAGPSAPFYRGAWSRPTANLVAIDDPGMRGDKTMTDLPVLKQNDQGNWVIDPNNTNTVVSARTDAQGYVTEQFADEMVKAYGSFSGLQKIFKPVMFGMNKHNGDLERAKPTYMKLSTAIILDPNNPKNDAHYAKFPNQLEFARKVYAAGTDIVLFNSGFKVGYHTANKFDAENYQTQFMDLDLFGLQNDPEHSVEHADDTISGGVQIHKQLADNGNFQDMIEFYTIEATMLRKALADAEKKGLSNIQQVKEAFERELGSRAHTGPIAEWLKDTVTPILDHPFTSEMAQNMVSSLFNKLGSLPDKPGKKYVNLSDQGLDTIVLTDDQKQKRQRLIEQAVSVFQGEENYNLQWAGPRTVEKLHSIDAARFARKVQSGDWVVNEDTGIIENQNGEPVIFPADVLVPENSGYNIGSRVISTRIPTTGKASSIPGRVVGTLPKELGNVIVTPKEGPGILGFDFDVDGLFTWHHTSGLQKEMDRMFDIAFEVLTRAKNYNEVTNPVSTDILEENAFFYSLSEEQAAIWDEMSPAERRAEMKNPDRLQVQYPHSKWGFARQLQLMKLNTVGKDFIGSSASYFGIYSVFSQTGVKLLDNHKAKILRSYNVDGASKGYPATSSDGQMVSNAFVQLINGATDNVKLMVLGRNNINLITGDVLMDMVAHGISLDYALAFINQPAVRDIVRTTEKLGSMVVEKDSTPAIAQLMISYKRIYGMVSNGKVHQSVIKGERFTSDMVKFSKEKLDEMYRQGNKNMSIDMVRSMDDIFEMFGRGLEKTPENQAVIADFIADQIAVIEKFEYYKGLASITRQGGKLAAMYSKNPKNYLELRKIDSSIEKVFRSENPRLSSEIFNHPSYQFQSDLIKRMMTFYRDNKITATNMFESMFGKSLDSMNEKEQKRFHDQFYNNIIFRTLERSEIDSSLLTGSFLTSVEFNEIFVRLVKDNETLFSENRFMTLLTPEVSNVPVKNLGEGEGKLSKLLFRGLKDFGDIELQEIRDSFFEIPNVEYNGHQVDVKKALIYFLAVNKGMALGGFSYSKILPKTVIDQFSLDLNNALKVMKGYDSIYGQIQQVYIQFDENGEMLTENSPARDMEQEIIEAVDQLMVTPLAEFEEEFFERNTDLMPRVIASNLVSLAKEIAFRHPDSGTDSSSDFSTGMKVGSVNGFKRIEIHPLQLNNNNRLNSFIQRSVGRGGFVIQSNGKETYYRYNGEVRSKMVINGKTVPFSSPVFVESKDVNKRHDIYDPLFIGDPSTETYVPTPKPEAPLQFAQEIEVITPNSIVNGDSADFIITEAVAQSAVVEVTNADVKTALESAGFVATRANPDVYYNPKRDKNSYTEEQTRKLKNEC